MAYSSGAEGSPLLDNIRISKQLEKDINYKKQAERLTNCRKYQISVICLF